MTLELLLAAHDYLDMGLRVIALTDKMPNGTVHRHGLDDAFTRPPAHHDHWGYDFDGDCETCALESAFEHPKTTGIGILTGFPLYVVDIDGPEGAAAWMQIYGELPDRWVARTGRGLHIYYGGLDEWPTTKLGEKLDFKGTRGYVAAPPSRHPDGHKYEWLLPPTGDEPLPAMPDELELILSEKRALREQALIGKQMRRQVPVSERVPGLMYAEADHTGLLRAVSEAAEGNRNNVLYWAAATLAEEGCTQEDLNALLTAAVEVGLTQQEATRTITSALEAIGG